MLAAIRVNFAFLELSILQLKGLRVQQVRTFSQCSGAFILVTGGILLNRRNHVVQCVDEIQACKKSKGGSEQ